MATATEGVEETTGSAGRIARAAGAGTVAGVVFGLMIQFGLERMTAIGAMYTLGSPSVTIGWIAHLFHSALFGAVFGLAVDRERLRPYADLPMSVVLGAGFGATLWAVNIVLLWPLWLNAVGLPNAPSLPFVMSFMPLVGHLVWGAVLGALYPIATH